MPRGKMTLPPMGTKAQRQENRMAAVLPTRNLVPDPAQWAAWHANVITPSRKTGARDERVEVEGPVVRYTRVQVRKGEGHAGGDDFVLHTPSAHLAPYHCFIVS